MLGKFNEAVAHITNEGCVQSVADHLGAVAKLASQLGKKFNLENTCYLAGILHDIGKLNPDFQNYIKDVDDNLNKGKIDHSTYGARLIFKEFEKSGKLVERLTMEMISLVIMSHHGGLQDCVNLKGKSDFLERNLHKDLPHFESIKTQFFTEILPQVEFVELFKKASEEVSVQLKSLQKQQLTPERAQFQIGLLIKLIFSVLIEADRSDTAQFVTKSVINRDGVVDWNGLIHKLDKYLDKFTIRNEIDEWRQKISDECWEFASQKPDVYDLTVPTGSGKTLSSLRYALRHAQLFNKQRIFFILPYTTIIEQNAMVVRNILGDDAVTEHHSGVITDDDEEKYDQTAEIKRFSQIKWNTPIVFTTMVQFLNAFYNSGTKDSRRLHLFGQSIIIFDEVQSVPNHTLSLFNETVNFMKNDMASTVVLSTATQPTLEQIPRAVAKSSLSMVGDVETVYEVFSRVDLKTDLVEAGSPLDCGEVVELAVSDLKQVDNILIVVNLTKTARDIFYKLKSKLDDVELVHLSTKMCPAHRKAALQRIREVLSEGKKLVCITTPLIEAGVDVSFKMVYRSLTGAASIVQAAGRCNRHGESGTKGIVRVLDIIGDQNMSFLKDIKLGADISRGLINQRINLLSNAGARAYFEHFFKHIETVFDYEIPKENATLYDLLAQNQKGQEASRSRGEKVNLVMKQAFKTAAKEFKVIDSRTYDVFVPYGDRGMAAIAELLSQVGVTHLSDFLKRNQAYIVSLYDYELKQLQNKDLLERDRVWGLFVLKEGAYNEDVGVDVQEGGLTSNVII